MKYELVVFSEFLHKQTSDFRLLFMIVWEQDLRFPCCLCGRISENITNGVDDRWRTDARNGGLYDNQSVL